MAPELVIFVGSFVVFAAVGGAMDVRSRIIPNRFNIVFLLTGLALTTLFFGWQELLWAMGSAAVGLAIGMLFFGLRLWGGGDGKFYAAASAWFTLYESVALLVSVALVGLFVAAGFLFVRRGRARTGPGARELPYGLAIAGGGLLLMFSERFGPLL